MDWDPYEPPETKVQRYIDGVLSGDIVVGGYVRAAIERHQDDLKNASDRGFEFDKQKATSACLFFPLALRHYNGEWVNQPFALSDNQAFIVWCLWGWRRIVDGTRRFRSAYLTAARKWGKSTFCAGLMLLATCSDFPPEAGAENLCVATKEDQARIVFEVAKKIRARSPAVQEYTEAKTKLIKTLPGTPQPDAILMPVGSDSDTSDGWNTHLTVMDELHAWKKQHQGLYDRHTTSGGSRRQPLIVIITTAGDDLSEIWKRRDSASCAILDASKRGDHIGDNHFAFVARIDAKDDAFDPENWPKANPNYPVTPKHDYLEEQAQECRHDPVEKAKFTRFHTNRMVSSVNKAIDDDLWAKAKGELSDWKEADYIGGGFDLGGYDDIASAARVAKFETDKVDEEGKIVYRYEVTSGSWINENATRRLDVDPWATWVANGDLIVTARQIGDIESYLLSDDCDGVAYDPNNARKSGDDLRDERGEDWAIEMPQTIKQFAEPIKQFKAALVDGRITHDGNPLLSWAVSNLQLSRTGLPEKPGREQKIDPIVAVFMAYRMALFGQKTSLQLFT